MISTSRFVRCASLALTFTSVLSLVGCKKDTGPRDVGATKAELLKRYQPKSAGRTDGMRWVDTHALTDRLEMNLALKTDRLSLSVTFLDEKLAHATYGVKNQEKDKLSVEEVAEIFNRWGGRGEFNVRKESAKKDWLSDDDHKLFATVWRGRSKDVKQVSFYTAEYYELMEVGERKREAFPR